MNEAELNTIKGLLHYYLNEEIGHELDAEVKLTDSNGDSMGVITWAPEGDEYRFEPLR